ncbi:PREDICTED: developmental pluripotency-associated protein 4-like, partial [Chrysochloris asiatica]|uniref:Developmental pluripotency-associated protein 4-like n=1 Tax=Chrysochloris asiatica TaxID=185453 RepID=A0A9B0T2K0_CHRAS
MEDAKGKEWNSTEKPECVTLKFEPVPLETEQQASNEPSTSALPKTSVKAIKRTLKEEKASCSQNAQGSNGQKSQKIPVPPLPEKLPPINLVHRDTVRAWCQKLKLSSKGQKLEAYRRLCEHAYPDQKLKDIPATAKEAKVQMWLKKKSNVCVGNRPLKTEKRKISSAETDSPEVAPPTEEMGAPALEYTLPEEVNPAQETCGIRWCVVHGRSLPANTNGWVHLQFHARQVWVPEKPGRVCALFLLPACNFPPPHL